MANSSVANTGRTTTTAEVELVVRQRGGKAKQYDVAEAGFLIGTVTGCDLRLGGNDLPPVICMIVGNENGADLRRLAPTYPIFINGARPSKQTLAHGDRISFNDVEIEVHVKVRALASSPAEPRAASSPSQPKATSQSSAATSIGKATDPTQLSRREQALAENEAQLNTYAEELAREKQEVQDLRRAVIDKE